MLHRVFKMTKKKAINYRPNSHTLVLIRLLEKVISEKIVTFLDTNNLVTENQHRSRKKQILPHQLISFLGRPSPIRYYLTGLQKNT